MSRIPWAFLSFHRPIKYHQFHSFQHQHPSGISCRVPQSFGWGHWQGIQTLHGLVSWPNAWDHWHQQWCKVSWCLSVKVTKTPWWLNKQSTYRFNTYMYSCTTHSTCTHHCTIRLGYAIICTHIFFPSSFESNIWIFCSHAHGFCSLQVHIFKIKWSDFVPLLRNCMCLKITYTPNALPVSPAHIY